jgi:uncharacterized membrane protein
MSLRHGPLVAALGLVGAYFVPLLVETDTAAALPLFGYLALVTAASLALLRHRAWWWLAWLSLAGTVSWVLLWLGSRRSTETPVVGGFLLLQFLLFGAYRRGIDKVAFLAGVGDASGVRMSRGRPFGCSPRRCWSSSMSTALARRASRRPCWRRSSSCGSATVTPVSMM